MEIKTERFAESARKEIQNERSRAFLKLLPAVIAARRAVAMTTFPDPEAAQAYGAAIREEVIARLPELLEEFEKNAVANGAEVFWARDSQEANEYITRLAKERDVQYVTKGKSMVTEEMGLNEALQENGIEAYETDLGEFIAQLLNRPPFHIVGPAVNVPVEQVRDLFLQKGVLQEETTDPVQLGYAARLFLRDKFHHLKMGVAGVNMAVAETGTIINVENEGNIRFTKSTPQTQVSIMSLEKVVPTMQDAVHLLRLLCRNCVGQKISSYVSMDTGPRRDDEIDGPEELFIVIIDNGRTSLYQDPLAREVLRCIRCGACLGICPIYRKIGGYPYGWAYSGPMGQVLNPLLLGLDRTQDLYRATTFCGACKACCPAGIDHPKLFRYYRTKDVEGDPKFKANKRPWTEGLFFKAWTWAAGSAGRWGLVSRMMRSYLNRKARDGKIREMTGPLAGWFKSRDLPALPPKTFHQKWKQLKVGK